LVIKLGAYEQFSLALVKVLGPLHISRVVGVVDLPVAHDGFRLPVIPTGSLKGALRGCFDEKIAKVIFGPEPRSEFYHISEIHFSPFLPVREHLIYKERKTAPCNVDCRPCARYVNRKCVGCLQQSIIGGSFKEVKSHG